MKANRGAGTAQPLSAATYAFIALAGLVLGVALLLFYVYEVPRLTEITTRSQVFYLLLIPWGLSCAAFLFGAMRSYARFTHKQLGSALELGGPVVLFALILVGGFKLVPAPADTVDLAVRAYSEDAALINAGQITLDLPGLPRATIGPDGEANFKGIAANFKGRTIRVLPHVEGYEEKWLMPSVDGNVLTVRLERAHPVFTQMATLDPPPPRGRDIQIRVNGKIMETTFDDLGGFKLSVDGQAGDRILLEVFVDRNLAGSEHYTLQGGPINVHWTDAGR